MLFGGNANAVVDTNGESCLPYQSICCFTYNIPSGNLCQNGGPGCATGSASHPTKSYCFSCPGGPINECEMIELDGDVNNSINTVNSATLVRNLWGYRNQVSKSPNPGRGFGHAPAAQLDICFGPGNGTTDPLASQSLCRDACDSGANGHCTVAACQTLCDQIPSLLYPIGTN